MPPYHKEYLGDGLYVEDLGYQIRLHTERDGRVHEVYLDDHVLNNFLDYMKKLQAHYAQDRSERT